MNVANDFKDYLVAQGLTTDAKIQVSNTAKVDFATDDMWAIVAQPGSVSGGNILQWKRTNRLLVLYRRKNGAALYDAEDALLTAVGDCPQLTHYKVARCTVNPMGELDKTPKEVHIGAWQVELVIIKKDEES